MAVAALGQRAEPVIERPAGAADGPRPVGDVVETDLLQGRVYPAAACRARHARDRERIGDEVMYNDFVIVGPAADPAGIKGDKDVVDALGKIAAAQAPFASRGDDSGTHKAELALWQEAGVDVAGASGAWYRETGSGMGPTLNTAAGMDAYALTDRGTWLAFDNRQNLEILVEGDPRLSNQYGIIMVNPAKHPHVKAKLGQTFIDWVLSDEGQEAIGAFKINGQQAFFPNAKD
jgi:tungstate transport system substrate-binding protein